MNRLHLGTRLGVGAVTGFAPGPRRSAGWLAAPSVADERRGRQLAQPGPLFVSSCLTRLCLPSRLILVRPVDTRKVRRALEQLGCTLVGTKGDHEKWRTPNGLTTTIVAGEKQQSPGLLRSVQRVFEPEFGEGWLEKEVGS